MEQSSPMQFGFFFIKGASLPASLTKHKWPSARFLLQLTVHETPVLKNMCSTLLQNQGTSKAQVQQNLDTTPGFFPPSRSAHTQQLRMKTNHGLSFDIAAPIPSSE
jgi:hypothetical protein